MKIHFGTTLDSSHTSGAVALGCVIFAINCANAYIHSFLDESVKSMVHSRGLNVTHTRTMFNCDLSYEDCLCSVSLNKFNTSENCITHDELVMNRLLPLVSFFLQIYLVRELFSLSADRPHVFIYALWIASIFIFTSMTISIYWSSCYHAYIIFALFLTGGSLFFLSLHNLLVNSEREHSTSDHKQIIIACKSESNNNASKGEKSSKSWDFV
jgi:hypothetical protein